MEATLKSFLQDSVLSARALLRMWVDTCDEYHYTTAETAGAWVHNRNGIPVNEAIKSDLALRRGALVLHKFVCKVLGAGHYSFVMAHPTDNTKVIKFFMKHSVDKCWKYITDVVIRQQYSMSEPWMPKVYSVGYCMGVAYAVMERLHPIYWKDVPNVAHMRSTFEAIFGYTMNDIHGGNIMHRIDTDGNTTTVLTDPCC